MSELIMSATMSRAGTTYAGPLMVQLDKMTLKEAVDYGGSNPHYTYNMLTFQLPIVDVLLVQAGDAVVDMSVVDPKTKAPRTYVIISDPEPNTLTMSWRWVAERQTRGGQ